MARWQPHADTSVAPSEHIGRRLFDEPKLFGASDQKPFLGLALANFEETRDRQFSVDRMGKTCVDKRVVRYLVDRASIAATTFQQPKTFHGWIVLSAKALSVGLRGIPLVPVPSPDPGALVGGEPKPWSDKHLDQNMYHAHIEIPVDEKGWAFAMLAREVFAKGAAELAPDVDPAAAQPQPRSKPRDASRIASVSFWKRWFMDNPLVRWLHERNSGSG